MITAFERGIYGLSVLAFGTIAYFCFHDIATTTGWAVVGYFFGGVTSAAAALGLFGILGASKSYKFVKKEEKSKSYGELEQDNEYNIALNG